MGPGVFDGVALLARCKSALEQVAKACAPIGLAGPPRCHCLVDCSERCSRAGAIRRAQKPRPGTRPAGPPG